MVKYTIENNKYEGERINYSSCESPKLTSTTLNTNVVTWDRVSTKTRYTTCVDTIPGTTSTTVVNSTRTYKCEIYSLTVTTTISKGEYMSFSVSRKSEPSTEYNGYGNIVYTDSYTALISENVPNCMASVSTMNGYITTTTHHIGTMVSTTTIPIGYPGSSISLTSSTTTIHIGTMVSTTTTHIGYPGSSISLTSSTTAVPKITTSLHRINLGYSSMSLSVTSYLEQTSILKSTTYLVTVPNFTITHSKTSTIYYTQNHTWLVGNSGTFAFTTNKGGASPELRILYNNNVINSTYVSNVESLLFYLGTISISSTTKTTSEREV